MATCRKIKVNDLLVNTENYRFEPVGSQKEAIDKMINDQGDKKKDLITRIQRIALYKGKIEFHNSDAVELVKSLRKTLPPKTLFYFDPPYYVKGKDPYLNYYEDKDHQEIATEIGKLKKQKWIVTYDNVNQIKNLYTDFRQIKYTLNYSAAEPSKGQEVMIFSDNMYITKHSIIA